MSPASIRSVGMGNGPRGLFGQEITRFVRSSKKCVCDRPHCRILCRVCGYLGWGRVKYSCPKHPQTIFLIDITQCPHCRSYANWMIEF